MLKTLRFIVKHPLNRNAPFSAVGRFLRWQLGSRLLPGSALVPFVGQTRLLARRGMTGATGNIYCGLHEFEDMALVLHTLRPGDWFVDVGANIGSYTVLAGGVCGASVLALEPVPASFECLLDNIRINRIESLVTAQKLAIGAHPGIIRFTDSLDTVNHVITANDAENGIDVPLETLDGLLQGLSPSVIKIDVEGYETEVIHGAMNTLADGKLLAVLVELNGSGARYGFDEDALHEALLEKGFVPCMYQPFSRKLIPIEGKTPGAGNTLYVRDLAALRQRLAKAAPFTVLGQRI